MKKQVLRSLRCQALFTRTPEPEPRGSLFAPWPVAFVIQKAAARQLHYDFRLSSMGSSTRSWRCRRGRRPIPWTNASRSEVEEPSVRVRLVPAESISGEREYGAGNVIVWDCGVYSPDEGEKYSLQRSARGRRSGSERRLTDWTS